LFPRFCRYLLLIVSNAFVEESSQERVLASKEKEYLQRHTDLIVHSSSSTSSISVSQRTHLCIYKFIIASPSECDSIPVNQQSIIGFTCLNTWGISPYSSIVVWVQYLAQWSTFPFTHNHFPLPTIVICNYHLHLLLQLTQFVSSSPSSTTPNSQHTLSFQIPSSPLAPR